MRFKIIFSLIVLLASLLRFYHLADKPHDLYIDEVAIGWNAYSILKTGRDEYGSFMPLSFRSFDDYKSPVYIYLTTLTEGLFGKTQFAVRLPSALAGVGSVATIIFLIQLLTNINTLALLSGLILAISPWHLQFSRAGFEANVALFFMLAGSYLFAYGLRFGSRGLFAGLFIYLIAIYTYQSPRVLAPILCISLIYMFRTHAKKLFFNKKNFLLLIPLILIGVHFFIFALSPKGLARASSESFTNGFHVKPEDFIQNKFFHETEQFFRNYFDYYSLDFLFFSGDQIGRHSVREIGMNYIWELPFFLFGLYLIVKKRTPANIFISIWFIASPIAAAVANPNPHALRVLSPVISVTFISALGLLQIFKYTRIKYTYSFAIICSLIVVYFSIHYLHIYYVHYPKRTSVDWSGGIREALQYAAAHENEYQHILLTNEFGRHAYIFLYFYGNFDPNTIQHDENMYDGAGKYTILSAMYNKPLPPHTLYLSSYYEKRSDHKIKDIYNAAGDKQFTIWEN